MRWGFSISNELRFYYYSLQVLQDVYFTISNTEDLYYLFEGLIKLNIGSDEVYVKLFVSPIIYIYIFFYYRQDSRMYGF